MRNIGFLMVVLLVGLFACAKSGEETLNYAQQIAALQHYNETLEKYLKSLEIDPEGKGEVTGVAQLLENYKADLLKIPKPVDSKLKTIHGRYERSIATSQRRLLPRTTWPLQSRPVGPLWGSRRTSRIASIPYFGSSWSSITWETAYR